MSDRDRERPPGRREDRPGPTVPLTPRQQFQRAMVESSALEVCEEGRPCYLCGEDARNPGIWSPTPSLAGYLGAAEGEHETFVYGLCDECMDKPDPGDRVEEKILRGRRTRLAAAEAGLEVAGGFALYGSPADLERFLAAFARNAPPP